jgi:hypothetical protein
MEDVYQSRVGWELWGGARSAVRLARIVSSEPPNYVTLGNQTIASQLPADYDLRFIHCCSEDHPPEASEP